MAATVRPAVPFVYSNGGLCSGALIEDRLVVTAKHCIEDMRPAWVSWPEKPDSWTQATVVYMDSSLDFALLELPQSPLNRKPIPLRAKGPLEAGTAAATLGHPTMGGLFGSPPFALERTHLFSAGHVSKDTGTELIVDFSISPGNSGGPVFDREGRLIGIVSRKLIQQFVGQIGYAVSFRPIQAIVELRKAQLFTSEPTAWDAPHAFNVHLQFLWDRYQLQLPGIQSSYRTGFDFRYVISDRWVINYSTSFGLNGVRFQSYGLGYRAYSEGLNKVPFRTTLSLEALRYVPRASLQTEKHAHAYNVTLGSPISPLSLKLSWISAYQSSYWGLGLILGN